MSINKFIKDESGQVAGIIMLFFLIVGGGLLYIALGSLVQEYVDRVNFDITSNIMPYSYEHMDAMDVLFSYWYFIPLIIIALGAIYALKNANESETSEAY